jgi:co-chaperonin GroES (HSP10)
MSTFDPTKVRPRDGWVVVLADQRRTKLDSGLLLPIETGVEKVTEGAGLLIRVGQGRKNHTLGLEAGQRVVYRGYLKYANPIPTEETWSDGEAKQYFVMSVDDLIGVMAPGVEVGVFSGRPQVPERK